MPTKGVRFARDPARPVTYEEINVTTAAVVSPANLPSQGVVLTGSCVENTGNGAVRYRVDGGNPTTALGHRLSPGAVDYFNEHEARAVKFIAETVGTTIAMTHYRE